MTYQGWSSLTDGGGAEAVLGRRLLHDEVGVESFGGRIVRLTDGVELATRGAIQSGQDGGGKEAIMLTSNSQLTTNTSCPASGRGTMICQIEIITPNLSFQRRDVSKERQLAVRSRPAGEEDRLILFGAQMRLLQHVHVFRAPLCKISLKY